MNKAQQILILFNEKVKSNSNKLSFDIDKEFDYLNKTLLDNQVIKPPILGFMTDRKRLGITRNMVINGKITTTSIEISDSYDLTKPQFLSVLLHEMIHALQDMKQMYFKNQEEAHNGFFISMRDQINNKIIQLGLENEILPITKTEKPEELNTFADEKLKDKVGIIILTEKNNQKVCSVFKLEILLTNIRPLTNLIKKYYGEDIELEFLKSDNSVLRKYKVTSKTTNFSFYGLSDKDYEIIKKDSEIIDDKLELDISSMPKLKKPVGVILLKKPDGETSIGVYGLEGMKETIPVYKEKFSYGYKKNFEVYFLASDSLLTKKYPTTKKDFKVIKTYRVDKDDYNNILQNSTIIDKLIL